MWREQIDLFWDGRRALAVGFFDGETHAAPSLPPEIAVVSGSGPDLAGAALADVIDAGRWRAGGCVLDLPERCAHVSLRAPDGAELRVSLATDTPPAGGGEWRLLLTETPDGADGAPAVFRLAALSASGDFERLARDRISRAGQKLVWAMGQRRQIERRDGAAAHMRLWPAQRMFPAHQSRIVIEAAETLHERCADPPLAPFAILEHWLRENEAPCVTLRLRVPSAFSESGSLLGGAAGFLVMNQRRHLRAWLQAQKRMGEPGADPLTLDDIRQAIDCPFEQPDAVESSAPVVARNLLKLIADPKAAELDGLAVRARPDHLPDQGMIVEIDFFAATLGDEVGIACAAALGGDLGVVPFDPGGAPYIRSFRVESDGLTARAIGDNDPLLGEILRLAADEEALAPATLAQTGAERAGSVQARRERLLGFANSSLAAAGYPGRFNAQALWGLFEPFYLSAFVALVAEAVPKARGLLPEFGGYEAFRADPPLILALARQPELAASAPRASLRAQIGAAKSLPHRFAAACGAAGLVAPAADWRAQARAWRLLTQAPLARRLATVRVALSGTEEAARVSRVTDLLMDETLVERAAAHCDKLEHGQEAAAWLRSYLEKRRKGEWTPFEAAERLALSVEDVNAYWREFEAAAERAATADAARQLTPPKASGLFATVRSLFTRASSKGSRA